MSTIKRRKTRTITIGSVKIGAGHPVAIQSMAKTDTADVDATVKEISSLEKAGCEIVRVALRDLRSAKAIKDIKKAITIPIVADCHFDYTLALEAIKQGASKIRINPGNISKSGEVDSIIDAAREKHIPIRIGVNSGSLPNHVNRGRETADKMAALVFQCLERFRRKNFEDIVISVKASDAATTVNAYRRIAEAVDYPLHIGVTAAGVPADGIVRSSAGIGALLLAGIGDTIRVSLTGDPVQEVETAKRILGAVGLRRFGPEIISCPACGRCQVDLISMVKKLEQSLKRHTTYDVRCTNKPLTVAVMGCEVNGPGEAKGADIGIAFGSGKGAIFQKGEVVKTVDADRAIGELLGLIASEQLKGAT